MGAPPIQQRETGQMHSIALHDPFPSTTSSASGGLLGHVAAPHVQAAAPVEELCVSSGEKEGGVSEKKKVKWGKT